MPLFDFNMDFNMDFNVGTPGSSVGGNATRVRFNTEDYRKYIKMVNGNPADALAPANPGTLRFLEYWDADLRSYKYLQEFLVAEPDWKAQLLAASGSGTALDLTPPHLLGGGVNTGPITTQIIAVLDAAPDRQDRFHEIVSQHGGEGAISYFLGMLMIDPSRMPAMNLLIRVARRIGEHISMVLKEEFRCPRPSQLCAAIVPMIDPPATPAFPSGHSLQARMIARFIAATAWPIAPAHLLDDLADRIGLNRIIAGLHYPLDHTVGKAVADWCFDQLLAPIVATNGTELKSLMAAADREIASNQVQLQVVS